MQSAAEPIAVLCATSTWASPKRSYRAWIPMRRPWAVTLAKAALSLFCVEGVARLSTRVDLTEAPPGTRLPRAILLLAHNAAWFLYLQKSRRVRTVYGLESPPNP